MPSIWTANVFKEFLVIRLKDKLNILLENGPAFSTLPLLINLQYYNSSSIYVHQRTRTCSLHGMFSAAISREKYAEYIQSCGVYFAKCALT
jgi:hypothetical protein